VIQRRGRVGGLRDRMTCAGQRLGHQVSMLMIIVYVENGQACHVAQCADTRARSA